MKHLHFDTAGNPENPPLLMVHGFMSSNLQWALNKAHLSQTHYLVMIENWGHGKSPASDSFNDYSPERYSSEVKAICDQLGIQDAGLVGHSFGSAILIHFALQHPEYVKGLLFTNSKAVIAKSLLNSEKLSKVKSTFEAPIPTDPEQRKALVRKFPMHPIHAKRLPAELKQGFIDAADNVPLESLQAFAGNRSSMACRHLLSKIPVPTLMVNGIYEKDLQSDVQLVIDEFSNIEVVDVEAGHSPNIDLPEVFNRILLDFLARL